jgi:hypothetical protein
MNDELVIVYESGSILRMMRWQTAYTLDQFIEKFLLNKGGIESVTIIKEQDKK